MLLSFWQKVLDTKTENIVTTSKNNIRTEAKFFTERSRAFEYNKHLRVSLLAAAETLPHKFLLESFVA